MKYCPYCGAALPDGAVSFCPECGENLPNMTEEREKKHEQPATSPDTATESRKATPKKVKQKRKQKELQDQDTESSSKPDDGYDGYYDDVLPADAGRLNEGISMVRRLSTQFRRFWDSVQHTTVKLSIRLIFR